VVVFCTSLGRAHPSAHATAKHITIQWMRFIICSPQSKAGRLRWND